MKTIVSFLIYLLIFVVIGGAIYFFAFWRPNTNRVYQLNRDIYEARAELEIVSQLGDMIPQLREDIERLGQELSQAQGDWYSIDQVWQENYLRFLPESFNELAIRERIYSITTSRSHNLNVTFQDSQPFPYNSQNHNNPSAGIWLTPVIINFTASYDDLVSLLNSLAHEELDNRIVQYSLTRQGDQWNVQLRLDILTQAPYPNGYINTEPQG